jgi:WXXGXW repeat (2 copies)
MKTNFRSVLVIFSSALAATALFSADSKSTPQSPATPSSAPTPAITETEALNKTSAPEPHYPAHPSTVAQTPQSGDAPMVHTGASTFGNNTDPNLISAPPPSPRSETKPTAPAGLYVWVPGHYAPMKGQWQWVPGEWSVPATPSSVWIEGRYDEKAKRYSPGYWQPDRPPAPQTNGNGVVKESPVTAPGSY